MLALLTTARQCPQDCLVVLSLNIYILPRFPVCILLVFSTDNKGMDYNTLLHISPSYIYTTGSDVKSFLLLWNIHIMRAIFPSSLFITQYTHFSILFWLKRKWHAHCSESESQFFLLYCMDIELGNTYPGLITFPYWVTPKGIYSLTVV